MVNEIDLLHVPKIPEERGNLSFLQNLDQLPFEIKRVYWINTVHGEEHNRGHANRSANEVVIALSGCFEVTLFDGETEKTYSLGRPDVCLSIPKMTWRRFFNCSTNSVVFVVSDQYYDEADILTDISWLKKEDNEWKV